MRNNKNTLKKNNRTDLIVGVVGLVALIGGPRACAEIAEEPTDKVTTFVQDSGFNNPIITDIDKSPLLLGCSKGDFIKYEIDAVSANTGRDVSIDVCAGVTKGFTIRD